ncbi:luciferin-binding protein-like [Lingula anatina]|uniref:Luciferin-binding protein-like n=1 Tax=Lingula anatina TaxID=7574 RepID=A0A1S3IUI3_LINAN|nr:luciferin-binding protein-like [Lingula anatina]|eukprot:XP_013401867.1 luciferin-binding protein-like [Lingula anatina]
MPDDYPQVKGSEVWRRKFRTRFRNLDSDGDGFVSANDYVMGALLVAERIGLGAKRTNALLESRLHVWKNISTNGTGVDTVTEEEFINNVLASVNSSIRHYIPTHGSLFVLPKRGFKKREFQLNKMPDDYPQVKGSEMPDDYPQVKGSEVWRRKFRTRFRNLDSDGDGFVTANDYVMGALLVAERIGLGAKRTNALLESRLHVWKNISTNGTGVDTVTEEEFINNVLASVNSSIRHYIPTHGSREFDTIDQDGVGFVSPKDHEQFFYGNAIPVHFSPEIFKVLDANGDGRLNREEFVQGWVDFLLGEDPESPYHCFLGPLVD